MGPRGYGGGEALANGPLAHQVQAGAVYIQAKTGPLWSFSTSLQDQYGWYMWQNYVMVYVSKVLLGWGTQPMLVMFRCKQHQTTYTVGYTNGAFDRIYVSCWTPPWSPTNYYPHSYNDVLVDTALVYGSNP
jgi:hypothetical protein